MIFGVKLLIIVLIIGIVGLSLYSCFFFFHILLSLIKSALKKRINPYGPLYDRMLAD